MKQNTFEQLFTKSKKGNYVCVKYGSVIASIFQKFDEWKWWSSGEYSMDTFTTPEEAFTNMQENNILEKVEASCLYNLSAPPVKEDTYENQAEKEWELEQHKIQKAHREGLERNKKQLDYLNSLPAATIDEMFKEVM